MDETPDFVIIHYGPPKWLQWVVFLVTIGTVLAAWDRVRLAPAWAGWVALLTGTVFFLVAGIYSAWKIRKVRLWLTQPTPTNTPDDAGL